MFVSKFFYWGLMATMPIGLSKAFDCANAELKDYDFTNLKGIHSVSVERDTPPSKTNVSWYFGICESIDKVENCPSNSDICGITEVSLPGSPPFISQIVSFSKNLEKKYSSFNQLNTKTNKNETGLEVVYEGANWGSNSIDARVRIVCADDDNKETYNFVIENWDGDILDAYIVNRAGCSKSLAKKPKSDDKNKDNDDSSWGWFTWVFIFLVLFLSIYIIGGAWFQYTRNNTVDFQSALLEVLENLIDVLKGSPTFFREVIEKIVGSNNRGEYSAV